MPRQYFLCYQVLTNSVGVLRQAQDERKILNGSEDSVPTFSKHEQPLFTNGVGIQIECARFTGTVMS